MALSKRTKIRVALSLYDEPYMGGCSPALDLVIFLDRTFEADLKAYDKRYAYYSTEGTIDMTLGKLNKLLKAGIKNRQIGLKPSSIVIGSKGIEYSDLFG